MGIRITHTLELPLSHSSTHSNTTNKHHELHPCIRQPSICSKILRDGIEQPEILVSGFLGEPQREDVEGGVGEKVVV